MGRGGEGLLTACAHARGSTLPRFGLNAVVAAVARSACSSAFLAGCEALSSWCSPGSSATTTTRLDQISIGAGIGAGIITGCRLNRSQTLMISDRNRRVHQK